MYLEKMISDLDKRIDQYLEPYREEVKLLETMPGVHRNTTILAEMGVDMNQFPSSAHLASWAGVSPGNHESDGKKNDAHGKRKSPYQSRAL